jgi:octaprenyl-diphosphate synthase
MTQAATISKPANASLDALYALIRPDLKLVDGLILQRVRNEVTLIETVAQHIIASGGKRIRPALTLISAQLCGYSGQRHIPLAASIEFIHTATLLHDDVVDESMLRRGSPTANASFGNKASILVGDFLLSQAFQLMVEDGSLQVLKILSDASAIISEGEVLQLMTEGEPSTSIEAYLQVIERKTAVLFAAACELGAVAGENKNNEPLLRSFGHFIGMAFQLIDDALDYNADQTTLGKTVGDDFREGKVTLPVITAYQAGDDSEKAFWQRTLGDGQQTEDDLTHAKNLIAKHGGVTATIKMAHDYCQQARQAIASFPQSPAKSAMLDIVDFCASRAY